MATITTTPKLELLLHIPIEYDQIGGYDQIEFFSKIEMQKTEINWKSKLEIGN